MTAPTPAGNTTILIGALLAAALALAAVAVRRLLSVSRKIRDLRARLAESDAKLAAELRRAQREDETGD